MVSNNFEKTMNNLKKDRTVFTKTDINFQEVMMDIFNDIASYTDVTLTGNRIDVPIKDNDPVELLHRVSTSVSNNLECPTFAIFMFKIVVRDDKISIIKKINENDILV